MRTALRAGDARLVILAEDASETQRKKLTGLLGNRGVPSAVLGTREELGRALGGSPLSALALTQPAFAERFVEKLEANTGAWERPATEEEEKTNAG